MPTEASIIRNPALAEAGDRKLRWVERHAPVLRLLRDRYLNDGTFRGLTVGLSIPIGPKVSYLATVLRSAGAQMVVTSPDPSFVQDDAAAALVERGITVYGSSAQHKEETPANFRRVLDHRPDLLVDDRGEFVRLVGTEYPELAASIRGASEQTTTGVIRLRAWASRGRLAFPVMAANDARCKHMFDNRYGTGQSTLSAILDTTNLLLAGKVVVVAGYGWVGRGVALRARGLHAQIAVTETDPVRALEAHGDGFRVMPMAGAAPIGDIFITCTGTEGVINGEHFAVMKDNALLANAGAVDTEIEIHELAAMAVRRQAPRAAVESFELSDGRQLHLLAGGRVVNVAAAEGHPVEIMDLTWAVQAMALYYLARHAGQLEPRVYTLPAEIDDEIAAAALAARDIELDTPPRRSGTEPERRESSDE